MTQEDNARPRLPAEETAAQIDPMLRTNGTRTGAAAAWFAALAALAIILLVVYGMTRPSEVENTAGAPSAAPAEATNTGAAPATTDGQAAQGSGTTTGQAPPLPGDNASGTTAGPGARPAPSATSGQAGSNGGERTR